MANWKDKTIAFLGDSITVGCIATEGNGYVDVVKRELNCKTLNYGVSGTRIASQKEERSANYLETFIERAKRMVEENAGNKIDFVFVFGGTNDYGHGDALMGLPSDSCKDTFNGAVNQLIDYLIEKFTSRKICFILPIPRFMQSSVHGEGYKTRGLYPLCEYIEAEKSALCRRGVDYLDLSEYLPEPKTTHSRGFFADGLHPNDSGHKVIAKRVIEYLEQKYGK